jgi:hypothetical protein
MMDRLVPLDAQKHRDVDRGKRVTPRRGMAMTRIEGYGNISLLSWQSDNLRLRLRGRSMSWGFEERKVYNRRADIHAKFGGQQQGGIITPSQYPLVIIITGEEGLEHGWIRRSDSR